MLKRGVVAAGIPHLVGRDADLALLRRRLEDALQGRGSLVLINGEAGIGKTSLAQALAGHAPDKGAIVALARCYEGSAPAFGLWQDLLTELGASAALNPAALPQPFGGAPSVQTAYQLMQSVVGALRSAAADRTLVLLLDDVHWADRDSLELLDVVTRRVESTSILIVVTYRSEGVHRHHPLYVMLPTLQRDRPVESVRLRRLDRAATAVIAEASCGPCSPQLIDSLHARSEGNPFFLAELLRDFKERQVLARADAVSTVPISEAQLPVVLQHVVTRRIARLGEVGEQLLQAAAIAGEEWDLGVVEAVLGWQEEQLLCALEAALEAKVVAPAAERAETYRFTHGLIRDVLYAEQVARRRKHLHERIAAILQEKAPSAADRAAHTAALAHHFLAAEQWEKALQYSMAAGDAARGRYGSGSALQFYEQALDILHRISSIHPEEQAALYERLGQVRMGLNQMEPARAAFEHMVQSARAGGDMVAEGRALLWLSFVQSRLSQMKEARVAGDAAVEMAWRAGDPRLLATGLWNLGRIYLVSGELALAPQHLDEAERLARQEGESTLLGRCLMEQARLSNWNGDYARAARQAAEGLELARTGRDSLFLAGLCWILGIASGELGHYSSALEVLHQGLAYTGEVEDLHYPVKLLNTIGWLHGEIGDTEAALSHDQQALDASRRGPADRIREAECYCLLNLATDRLQLGDVEAAELHLQDFEEMDKGIEYARFRYLNRYHLTRSQLALARHDPEEALSWARAAEDAAAAKRVRKNLAKSWMLTGQALIALKRPKEAVAELRRSVALADELQHGSLRWLARVQLARAHLAARQTDEAATVIRRARELVAAVETGLEDERLRHIFFQSALAQEVYALGAELERPPPAPTFPAGLTVREVEVLRLVARGATNKEIAGTLYISVKTVNAHLNSIFTKADCNNRAAAAAFAFRHGLA